MCFLKRGEDPGELGRQVATQAAQEVTHLSEALAGEAATQPAVGCRNWPDPAQSSQQIPLCRRAGSAECNLV